MSSLYQLSYVHPQHAAAASTASSSHAAAASTASSSHAAVSMAAEARRWKEEHSRMQGVASELAFQTSALQKDLAEVQAKHRNLHANHTAMQAKYQALKQEAETRGTRDSVDIGEERQKHLKWKARAQQLAEQFEAHTKESTATQAEHNETMDRCIDLEAEVEGLQEELEEARTDAAAARAQAATTAEGARRDQAALASLKQEAARDAESLANLEREAPRVKLELKAGAESRAKLALTEAKLDACRAQYTKDLEAARAQSAKELEASHAFYAKERKSTAAAHALELEAVRAAAVGELAAVRAEAQKLQARVSVDSVHEASRASTELLQSRAELERLRKLEQEVPAVQARLKQGEAAVKEVAVVQARADAAAKELADTRARADAAGRELATARLELAAAQQRATGADRSVREAMRKEQADAVAQAVARQSEVMAREQTAAMTTAGKQLAERYERAARQQTEALARASDSVKACTHMLTTAERVLRTCAEVQAKQETGAAMAQALDDTAAKLAHFLKALCPP